MANDSARSFQSFIVDITSADSPAQAVAALNSLLDLAFSHNLLPDPKEIHGVGFTIAGCRYVVDAQTTDLDHLTPQLRPLVDSDCVPCEIRLDSLETLCDLINQRSSPQMLMARRKLSVRGCIERLKQLGDMFQKVDPQRIQSLLGGQSSLDSRTPAGDSGMHDFWKPDDMASSCSSCGRAFNAVRRRHHCRECGDIFCRSCAPRKSVLKNALQLRAAPPRKCIHCGDHGGFSARLSRSDSVSTASSWAASTSCRSSMTAIPSCRTTVVDKPLNTQQSAACDDAATHEVLRLQEELRKMQEIRLHDFSSTVYAASVVLRMILLIFPLIVSGTLFFCFGLSCITGVFVLASIGFELILVLIARAEESLWRRRAHVFWAAFVIFVRFRWTKLRCRDLKKGSAPRELLWQETHRTVAFYVYQNFLALRGFWVKVGQYVSTRQDVMPEPYIEWLSKLQDQMPEASLAEVQQTLEEELGPELTASLLIQAPALASASIAQVHKAKLVNDGKASEEVVVKVQHRGIDKIMMLDVRSLELILMLVAWVEPDFDFRPLISEWKAASVRELDFTTECENTQRARKTLANAGLLNKVYIPEIVPKFTRRRVLVMEYIDGVKVDLVRRSLPHADPECIVQTIIDAFAIQLHVDGHFNGDPHPGNILVERSTLRPVLLDWGLCKTFSEASKRAFAKMVYAVDAKDIWTMMDSFEEMGFKFHAGSADGASEVHQLEPSTILEVMRFVLRDPVPVDESRELMMKRAEVDDRKFQHDKSLKRRDPCEAFSGEVLFFFRTVDCLQGLCSGFGVKAPFLKTLAARARASLVGGPPGSPHDLVPGVPVTPPHGFKGALDEKLHRLLSEFIKNGRASAAQVSVVGQRIDAKHSPVFADAACGVLGPLDPRPVSSDTLFVTHGLGQLPLTLMLLHLLDSGDVRYEEHVARRWPNFAKNGKDKITVAHILERTSGLWHCFPPDLTLGNLLCLDKMMAALEKSTPLDEPGTLQVHHYWTFAWLLAGICRHLAGRELSSCWDATVAAFAGCYSKEMLLSTSQHTTQHSAIAQVEKPPCEGIDAGELMGAIARLAGEVEGEPSDVCGRFLKPIFTKEHLLDAMLYNLPKAKSAMSLSGQGVHASARAMAHMLVQCAPSGQPVTCVQHAMVEASGKLSGKMCDPGPTQKTDLIKALSESAVPLPGILSQVFRDTASSSWPATGRFGRYGLQGLSAAAGAGCFAPESGSFAYWLPDHAEGPCAVCLLVSRVDATESGLANAVLQMVCEQSKHGGVPHTGMGA